VKTLRRNNKNWIPDTRIEAIDPIGGRRSKASLNNGLEARVEQVAKDVWMMETTSAIERTGGKLQQVQIQVFGREFEGGAKRNQGSRLHRVNDQGLWFWSETQPGPRAW
jgi:hypothetical protein